MITYNYFQLKMVCLHMPYKTICCISRTVRYVECGRQGERGRVTRVPIQLSLAFGQGIGAIVRFSRQRFGFDRQSHRMFMTRPGYSEV